MATPDITVRGAGIFGLSIAWACVQRGARVQVIDPYGPAAGSSGGVVGALAPHVPENWNPKKQFQLESLLMAEAFWAEAEAAGGVRSGYARTGRLQPVADAPALAFAQAREKGAETFWRRQATWSVVPATDGWAPHSPTGFLIHDTLSARIHPQQACAALVAALAANGVAVTSEGEDHGKVLWATGVAGLEALTAQHHRSVGNGVKGQAALLKFDASDAPQLFADTLHIVPHADGTVGVGSTSERDYVCATQTDEQLDDILTRVRVALPVLADAPVIGRWAGARPRARSRAPMLGSWPGRSGHFIANGGFKIGFGVAPKVAETMADLMLEGRDTIPDGFDVTSSY